MLFDVYFFKFQKLFFLGVISKKFIFVFIENHPNLSRELVTDNRKIYFLIAKLSTKMAEYNNF